jgi:hypothetical protein
VSRAAAVVLDDLERACVEADKALRDQRWTDCDAVWIAQRKLTHELEVAIRDLPIGSPDRKAVFARITRIAKYRDGQLRRLRAFHTQTGKRLATMERFRRFSKTVVEPRVSRLLDQTH